MELKSLFNFHEDTIKDFLFGDCEILAFYLEEIMKKHKKKCKVYFTSSDQIEFIHVLVYFKGMYIDILGIHTYEEVCKNHAELYNVPENELYLDSYNMGEFREKMRWNESIEQPLYWKSAEKIAEIIFNSSEIRDLLYKKTEPSSVITSEETQKLDENQ